MLNLKILLNRILVKFKFLIKDIYYIGGNDVLPPPLSKKKKRNWSQNWYLEMKRLNLPL